jgi:hypothetical protein
MILSKKILLGIILCPPEDGCLSPALCRAISPSNDKEIVAPIAEDQWIHKKS